MRKIILYPQSAMKPIILTDSGKEDISILKQRIMDCLADTKISILETESDSLIIRPSEIQAVLITDKEVSEDTNEKKSNYDKTLTIPPVKGSK